VSRYDPPDPLCKHKPVNRATAGGGEDQPHASTYVCGRPVCIADALAWVYAQTHLVGEVVPLPVRQS
jgi:hypothetical protein